MKFKRDFGGPAVLAASTLATLAVSVAPAFAQAPPPPPGPIGDRAAPPPGGPVRDAPGGPRRLAFAARGGYRRGPDGRPRPPRPNDRGGPAFDRGAGGQGDAKDRRPPPPGA